MSSHTWVCFHCRERVRRPAGLAQVRCRLCGKQCDHFGTKIEAPPRSKVREWAKLQEWYFERLRSFYQKRDTRLVARKHWLEREIERHRRLPEDKQRRVLARRLEEELRDIAV